MYIALLGRQPELSIAELERVYGSVEWFSPLTATVTLPENAPAPDVRQLGGTQKFGRVVLEVKSTDWKTIRDKVTDYCVREWKSREGKITLGISLYDHPASPQDVQGLAITVKNVLKAHKISVRTIPNQTSALSTATSHHNKLGLGPNKVELLIVVGKSTTIVAESTGAQNISALAARDQGRPRRDAFVGMLPPKLAQLLINLATSGKNDQRLLDPFCGTGVILQEAALLGNRVYGTDLADKMIQYSTENLAWLQGRLKHQTLDYELHAGDAMTTQWHKPITAVATEMYLGQPFSAPPSPAKLADVRGTCTHILSGFLTNLGTQLAPGSAVVVAIPAWRTTTGEYEHLHVEPLIAKAGFSRIPLQTVQSDRLMYFRPDQVVARELLLLERNELRK